MKILLILLLLCTNTYALETQIYGTLLDSGKLHSVFKEDNFRLVVVKRALSGGNYIKKIQNYAINHSLDYDKDYCIIIYNISNSKVARMRFFNAPGDRRAIVKIKAKLKTWLKDKGKTEAEAEDIAVRGKIKEFTYKGKGRFKEQFEKWRGFI